MVYDINPEGQSACYLLYDGKCAVAVDPGMAYSAKIQAEQIRSVIGDQPVEAVLLTHSHYDHVAAIPYFKKIWPHLKIYGAAYAKKVLSKPEVRKTMRELSENAAALNQTCLDADYDESLLGVDEVVSEGDILHFGDMTVRVIETIGHTRCSLSYFVDEHWLLAGETFGLSNHDGSYNPEFLVSFKKARESIDKCRQLPVKTLCFPHKGMVEDPEESGLWQWLSDGLDESLEVICRALNSSEDPEAQLELMEKRYWMPWRPGGWPRKAFDLNAAAMLRTVAREFPERIENRREK